MAIVKISDLPLVDSPVEGTDLFVVVQDNVTKKAYASDIQTYVGFEEIQYATAGQTVFNLTTMSYAPGGNNLMVFVDGVNQYEGLSYTETNSTRVTFTQGLHVGAVVKFSTVQTQTSLVANAGAVTFLQAGTGAVARSVQSKERDIVSVKDFGAVGDGVTDDTVAIQTAHNYAVSNGYFPTIVFPAGNYKFTTLNWSPYASARALGLVFLRTNLASGTAINVSTQYGQPPVFIFNTQKVPIFDGSFIIENTYGDTTTATAFALGDPNLSSPVYECGKGYFGAITINYFYTVFKIQGNCYDLSFTNLFCAGNTGPNIVLTGSPVNTGAGMNFYNCYFVGDPSKVYVNQYLLALNTIATCDFNFITCTLGYLYGGLNDPNPAYEAPGTVVSFFNCHHEFVNNSPHPYLVNKNKVTFVVDGGQSSHVAAPGGGGAPSPFWSETHTGGKTSVVNLQYVIGATVISLFHDVKSGGTGTFDYVPNVYKSPFAPMPTLTTYDGTVNADNVVLRENATYTPTWSASVSNPAIGNGSLSGNYSIVGKQVNLTVNWSAGSTTTFGSGVYRFSLPFNSDGYTYIGAGLLNGTANNYTATAFIQPSATNVITLYINSSPAALVTETAPVTWANGNSIQIQISYRRA